MSSNRRRFFEAAATSAAAFAVLPALAFAEAPSSHSLPHDIQLGELDDTSVEEWDVAWADKITGKHKAIFDLTETESGYGVWRGAIWVNQYTDVMKAAPADFSPVLVIRHNAIVLAMQQTFWDRYNTGEVRKVTHPLTGETTKKNPVLLDERDGLPAPYSNMALHKQIARGATVLACNLALEDCVGTIMSADKVSKPEARKRAIAYLVPGVILQPSGVFAVIRAQQAGASYIKAS